MNNLDIVIVIIVICLFMMTGMVILFRNGYIQDMRIQVLELRADTVNKDLDWIYDRLKEAGALDTIGDEERGKE